MKSSVAANVCLLVLFALAAGLFVFPAHRAYSSENAMEAFADGVMAFEDKDYATAEANFQQALSLSPENPEFTYYLALVYAHTDRTDLALGLLDELVKKEPGTYRKAYFDIAAIYSSQSQYEKALAVLTRAEEADPSDGRAHLERAAVLKALDRYDEALAECDKAAAAGPEYAGSAKNLKAAVYYDEDRFDEAEELFRQVASTDPGSPLALAAAQSLAAVGKARAARKPWYVDGVFALGYDDNVINKPLDPSPGVWPEDKGDAFEILAVSAGLRPLNRRNMRAGGGVGLNTVGYEDLNQNNILAYNPFLFFEADQGRLHYRVRYDYNYYYTGGDKQNIQDYGWYLTFASAHKKLAQNQLAPGIAIDESNGLRTDASFTWLDKNYLDLTPDAQAFQIALIQTWQIPDTRFTARAGYTFYRENSRERENSYLYHQGTLGCTVRLPWSMRGDLSYGYVRTMYENNPLLWVGDREDSYNRIAAYLAKTLSDNWEVSVSYFYGKNSSNVVNVFTGRDDYEYQRNVYQIMVTARF
ncbi:MAG: tetratricopeptide repeat protein [Thermodesulfobacteriota bacterium]